MEHKLEDPNPKSKTVRLSKAEVQNLKSKIASQTSMIDGYSLISPQVSIHK